MSILARLKAETQADHDAVEGAVGLLDPDLARGRYARVLARFLGVYRPLEARLAAVPGLADALPDLPHRWKAHRLIADLAAVGFVEEVADAPDAPEPRSVAAGLGCLYVVEGATLGGQLIRRHVNRVLGLTPETGCGFFAGYGDQTGARWQAFRVAVERSVTTPEQQTEAVAAARATFAALRHWLRSEEGGKFDPQVLTPGEAGV